MEILNLFGNVQVCPKCRELFFATPFKKIQESHYIFRFLVWDSFFKGLEYSPHRTNLCSQFTYLLWTHFVLTVHTMYCMYITKYGDTFQTCFDQEMLKYVLSKYVITFLHLLCYFFLIFYDLLTFFKEEGQGS